MSIINYAIAINTTVGGTYDASVGLSNDGYIRYITGRPGYDASPPYPTWEDTTNNTHEWFEGFLTKNGLGTPNRQIDIEQGGDYASISGFNFTIQNSMKLWKKLQDLYIDIINCDIYVYAVIDDVFHPIWSGIIENDPYTEIENRIECNSNSRKIHTTIPPNQLNANI